MISPKKDIQRMLKDFGLGAEAERRYPDSPRLGDFPRHGHWSRHRDSGKAPAVYYTLRTVNDERDLIQEGRGA